MSTTVVVTTFPPFPTLTLSLPLTTPLADLPTLLRARYPALPLPLPDTHPLLSLSPLSLPSSSPTPASNLNLKLKDLCPDDATLLTLRLGARLLGGKGGFGSQLRAAGGRMSSQKTSNNDSCRDLSGRRLSTIKEAKKLADYMSTEAERKKAAQEAQRQKLEALERKIAAASGGPEDSGKKRRLDDTEYLEQTQEIKDGVRNAVSAAFLKKKKKAKTSHPTDPASASTSASTSSASPPTETKSASNPTTATSATTTLAEKIADSPVVDAVSKAVGVASG